MGERAPACRGAWRRDRPAAYEPHRAGPAGSYAAMMTPVPVVAQSVRRRAAAFCAVAEELLPGAKVHGKQEQAIFVHEVVLDERLGEPAAAVNLRLVSRPVLELGDLGGDVAAREPGVVPVDGAQGGRDGEGCHASPRMMW